MNSKTQILKKWLINSLSVFFLLSISLLSGCASLNSDFDCKMKPGVMCKNLDQVNNMVDQGKLGNPYAQNAECKNCGFSSTSSNLQKISGFNTPYPNLDMKYGDPVRYGETVLRVWIAPYQDKDGNYYQAITLYTIIKEGHWIGVPVHAIDNDGNSV